MMFFSLLISLFSTLHAVDINSAKLGLMGELQGRSIIIKVMDDKGKKVAVFKPTSGSTFYKGEFTAYKLAEFVGIGELYPPTVIVFMTPSTQAKVKTMLDAVAYSVPKKEENRKILLEEINRNIETGKDLYGALKTWITDIQFYKPLGSKQGFKLHPVYKYIKVTSPRAPHKPYTIEQCTQLIEPKGCMSGTGYLDQMTRDMSSIMLLDAVIGNSDRFPGGNLHFKVTGKTARLFSLDNGAVLKPNDFIGFEMLDEFGVSRFVKKHVDKLRQLKTMPKENVMKLLGFAPEDYEIFIINLNKTLEYIDDLKESYRNKVWF
ncbi:MAG: hypothetical protein V1647_02970 [Pseudomonadota bacterium]